MPTSPLPPAIFTVAMETASIPELLLGSSVLDLDSTASRIGPMETDTSSRRAHSLRAVLLHRPNRRILRVGSRLASLQPSLKCLFELSVNGTGAHIQTEELVCASTSQVSLCCRSVAFIPPRAQYGIDQLTCHAEVKSLLSGRTISVYRCVIKSFDF